MGLLRLISPLARRQFLILPGVLLAFVLSALAHAYGDQQAHPVEAIERFQSETVFWKQLEIGQKIVLANDNRVLPQLESWLTHPDRHVRGNTAFVFGGLGDRRGFEVIAAFLSDFSDRPEVQAGRCRFGAMGVRVGPLLFRLLPIATTPSIFSAS
jgi:hypothetical protein